MTKDKIHSAATNSGPGNGYPHATAGGDEKGDVSGCLVSAIVSTYNSERFLAGCLEDMEAQTIADRLEIVVVDSGSQQNERHIVETFQAQYRNITYIRTEIRESVYASWNRGIKAAHGKYITNANTDDRHSRDAFERMSGILEQNPAIALVYADVFVTENENETFRKHTRTGYWSWYDWDRNNLLDKGCFIGPQPMWRRSVHDTYGYFDEKLTTSGDYEFWLRISQTFNFFHIKEPLGLYLDSPGSVEHRSGEVKSREDLRIIRQYKEAADEGIVIHHSQTEALDESRRKAVSRELLCKTSWWPVREKARAADTIIRTAKELKAQGLLDASIQKLFEGIKGHPGEIRLYHALAEILIEANLYDDALHILRNMPASAGDTRRWELAGACCKSLRPSDATTPDITVSLCMIVKNEAETIGQCLLSVHSLVHEIIVVDTGSTDRTREIAAAFGATIYDFPWINDFSAARNFSLSKASGTWILVLDADEVISEQDAAAFLQLTASDHSDTAYDFVTRNYITDFSSMGWTANTGTYSREEAGYGWFPSNKVRLFPRREAIRFEYPIHEIVENSLKEAGIAVKRSNIPIHHYGKIDRARDLVKGESYYLLGRAKLKEMKDNPKFISELAIQGSGLGRDEEALDLWRQVVRLEPNNAEAFMNISALLIKLERYGDALDAANRARKLNPRSAGVFYNCAICEFFTGDLNGAVADLDQLLRHVPEYIPAAALKAAAHILNRSQQQGFAILTKLQERGIDCAPYLRDLSERLLSANRRKDASLLSEATSNIHQRKDKEP
jgi:glycosyltransferase involved in cell wall biosynthesis